MLNWIVRNKTVWSLNCGYLHNMFPNHMFNKNVKTGLGIR